MTLEEAFTLRTGDVVEFRVRDELVQGKVIYPLPSVRGFLRIRRLGFKTDGSSYLPLSRAPRYVSFVRHLDPAAANVYADFLEERGELRAAMLLREAFPLSLLQEGLNGTAK